jgi:putative FmdB family regulatory protein
VLGPEILEEFSSAFRVVCDRLCAILWEKTPKAKGRWNERALGSKLVEKLVSRREDLEMPIYEFRCLSCGELFELLFVSTSEPMEVRCPHCGGEGGERVMSVVQSHGSQKGGSQPQPVTRSCPGGTCSSFTLPGHTK